MTTASCAEVPMLRTKKQHINFNMKISCILKRNEATHLTKITSSNLEQWHHIKLSEKHKEENGQIFLCIISNNLT